MGEIQPRYSTEISHEHYYKYREGKRELSKYWSLYYPNDSNMIEKTLAGALVGSIPGGLFASLSIVHDKQGFQFIRAAESCLKHFTPWVLVGAVYGLGVSSAAQLRKKEDFVNHMIGGYGAGTMLGIWYKNARVGFWTGVAFGATGGLIKYLKENDGDMEGVYRRVRVFNMYRRGWFIDRPNVEGVQDAETDASFQPYRP